MEIDALTAEALRPPCGPRTVIVVLDGVVDGDVLPAWCSTVRTLLLQGRADEVTCDVERLEGNAGPVIDALARLQLAARRSGGAIRLRHAQPPLREILTRIGMEGTLPVCGGSGCDGARDVEDREQAGLEEGVDADDPAR